MPHSSFFETPNNTRVSVSFSIPSVRASVVGKGHGLRA